MRKLKRFIRRLFRKYEWFVLERIVVKKKWRKTNGR